MATLTWTPKPPVEATQVSVAGTGYANARLRLYGSWARTPLVSLDKPSRGGSWRGGFTAPAAGDYTLTAQQFRKGAWVDVTTSALKVIASGGGTPDPNPQPPPTPTPTPITISSGPVASAITETTATVTWTTSVAGTTELDYGTTTGYGTTRDLGGSALNHTVNLTGLVAGTTYHYRVRSDDAAANTVQSGDSTFATSPTAPPPSPTPISISSGPSVGGITSTGATISWTTNVAGTSVVRYGTTSGYGSTATGGASVTSHNVNLTGLSPSTTYHYQVESVGAVGTATSTDRTFATSPTTPTPPPSGGSPNIPGGLSAVQLQSALQANTNAGIQSVLTATTYAGLTSTIVLTGSPQIDLNGATLQWTSNVVGIRLENTHDAVLVGSGGRLRGFDSSGIFHLGDESSHGIQVGGGTNVTIGRDTAGDLTIENFRGDDLYAVVSFATGTGVIGSGLTINDGVTFGTCGRMGIGIVGFNDGTVGAAHFVGTMYRPIDFEPDWASGYQAQVRRWTVDGAILNGNFRGSDGSGANWLYIGTPYSNPGGGLTVPSIEDITVKNCSITSSGTTTPHNAMFIDVRDYTAHRIHILTNIATNNWNTGLTASHVDVLEVKNNDMNSAVAYPVTSSVTNPDFSGNT